MTKKLALAAFAAVGLAGTALADSHPTVTLGGHLDTYWGYVSESEVFRDQYPFPVDAGEVNRGSKRRDNALVNETKLIVRADGRLEHHHHIKYGGLIYLNADTSPDNYPSYLPGENFDNDYLAFPRAQQTMAYFEGNFGRFEAGSFTGSTHALHVSATQIARGHSGIDGGGIDSDWWMWINPIGTTADTDDMTQMMHTLVPQLLTNNIGLMGIQGVNAAKITYFTPTWHGFKGGFSYTPDTESHGTVFQAMQETYKYDGNIGGEFRDVLEGGIHYAGRSNHIGYKAAFVAEAGDAKMAYGEDYHKLRGWELGGAAQYMGWTVAGAFGTNGKAGQIMFNSDSHNKYWDVGVAYEHGPFGISVTYASTKSSFDLWDEGEYDISHIRTFAVGADWRIAKGLKLYVDAVHFSNKVIATDEDDDEFNEGGNRGTVVRVGSLFNF